MVRPVHTTLRRVCVGVYSHGVQRQKENKLKTPAEFDALLARSRSALQSFNETSARLKAARADRAIKVEWLIATIEHSVDGLPLDSEEYVIADYFLAMYQEELESLR